MPRRTTPPCQCAAGHRWPPVAAKIDEDGNVPCPECGRPAENYITRCTCSGCQTLLTSPKPLLIGKTIVRCLHCRYRFRVEKPIKTAPLVQDTHAASVTVSPLPFFPPTGEMPQLPGYTLLAELGRGAMGVV
jgi:hypothetical protein